MEKFRQCIEVTRKHWIENRRSENWSDQIVVKTLNKPIGGKKIRGSGIKEGKQEVVDRLAPGFDLFIL